MNKTMQVIFAVMLLVAMLAACAPPPAQTPVAVPETQAPVEPTTVVPEAPIVPTAIPTEASTEPPVAVTEAPTLAAPAEEVMKVVPQKGTGTVYYLAMIGNNVWEVYAANTFEKYAKDLGYEFKALNAENSADNQVNQLSTIIPLKPKAVFLKSVDTSLIADTAQQAVEAGIPVCTFDGSISTAKISLNVDVGLVKYGQQAGEEILKYLKEKYGTEKGKVLNLMGDVSVPYSPLMSQGFHEVLDKYSEITVIDKDTVGWEITAAANVASDQLTVNPDIDAMFVHTDSRFPGVVSVLEEKGYKKGAVYLIGVDGDPTALKLIRDGWVNATITPPMNQYIFGCYTFLDQLSAGETLKPGKYDIDGVIGELVMEELSPKLIIPGILITPTNVDDPTLWGNAEIK
jgi:ribose transport system substrate-binding protein